MLEDIMVFEECETKEDETILLIDGHNIAYITVFSTIGNNYEDNGVFKLWRHNFYNKLFHTINELKPTRVVLVFDVKNSWRYELYPEYKGNRKKQYGKYPLDKEGFLEALNELIEEIFRDDQISVNLSSSYIDPLYLSPHQTAQLLPIVQEALLNARNHASPTTVEIKLSRSGEMVQIDVIDNGKGFDKNTKSWDERRHFGLSIMRARANRIGGQLRIDSDPGRGSRVRLVWRPIGDHTERLIPERERTGFASSGERGS